MKIMESLKLNTIVCVFYHAIYSKACKIMWREAVKFSKCVLMMEMFHRLMIYMHILYKRFSNAGMKDP